MSWPFPPEMTGRQRCCVFVCFLALGLIPIGIILICEGPPTLLTPSSSKASPPSDSPNRTNVAPRVLPTTSSPVLPTPDPFRKKRHTVTSCTPSTTRMITLCVPNNKSWVVEIDFASFPVTPVTKDQGGDLFNLAVHLSSSVWYVTLGGWHQWKWSSLVSETDLDWSKHSRGQALHWRNQNMLRIAKKPDLSGLIFTLKDLALTSCQQFILAPWTDRTALYWQMEICPSVGAAPSSVVKDDNPTFNGPPVTYTNGGRNGRIRIVDTNKMSKDDLFQILTGISGATNNWLLLAEQAADKTASDCIVCMGARPTLRVVPAPVNSACLLHLMNNTKRAHCSYLENHFPKTQRSVSNKPPFFSSDVAVNNFTCINLTGNAVKLGSLNSSWCTEMTVMKPNFRPTARADLWWWCGNNKLYDGFPRDASGLCALITLILPVLVTPVDLSIEVHEVGLPSSSERRSKRSLIPGSAHNPTYIDAVGIPRGVPDEYKLRDQVKAGWASILWMVEINANVDRINYIHFNVQLLANYTRDGFEAVHAQLSATSLMAFQNRVATDFLLAERGGVCSLFGQECCTYIPNNTAPDGSLTKAITGLTALTVKMKEHSGVDTAMWDSWLNMFGKYKALVASILVSISVFVAILVTCGCCCIPCIRSLIQRLIVTALTPEDKDLARQMPLLAGQLPTSSPTDDENSDREGDEHYRLSLV
uniref:Uncharacterized protein n=1 Tax=Astatotilapia calliptera TaxID=8154 RepID=A0AAX7VDI0_ASTCA